MPTLHQAATACDIPGKFDVAGEEVFSLWKEGKYREIIEYNVFDALTTYLLWLRCAYFTGLFNPEEYHHEQEMLAEMLKREVTSGHQYLAIYLYRWKN